MKKALLWILLLLSTYSFATEQKNKTPQAESTTVVSEKKQHSEKVEQLATKKRKAKKINMVEYCRKFTC